MSELPTPEEIKEAAAKSKVVAGLVRDHYEALIGVDFKEEDAFELAQAYHWFLIGGSVEDAEEA